MSERYVHVCVFIKARKGMTVMCMQCHVYTCMKEQHLSVVHVYTCMKEQHLSVVHVYTCMFIHDRNHELCKSQT